MLNYEYQQNQQKIQTYFATSVNKTVLDISLSCIILLWHSAPSLNLRSTLSLSILALAKFSSLSEEASLPAFARSYARALCD